MTLMGSAATFTVRGPARGPRSSAVAVRCPTVIEVAGDLDRGAAMGFRVLMREFIGDPRVAIDLSRCQSIDESGLGALIGGVRRIRDAGGDAWVSGVTGAIAATLASSGAGQFLHRRPLAGQP